MDRSGWIGKMYAPCLNMMMGSSYRCWSCDLGHGRSREGSRLLGGDWRGGLAGSVKIEKRIAYTVALTAM